ncbi:MAG TPA: LAGLIDADG family homing endonuclease, partial [Gammaproteobacteria bacterium]|nr:LAGLIDADG family homing endonuclease [Gammaproteobacteria bacterium]
MKPAEQMVALVTEIPVQEASADIWDKKYRLKAKDGTILDQTVDDTWQRVARALADVEAPEKREQWYGKFLWALRHGAIPAGRITSNAGALAHKPATSTINCTVSGTIRDSMDDILGKVHEAGLTLKAGCVAPGTWVRTEHGLVTVEQAVGERHRQILSYDRDAGRFEMRPVIKHLTVDVKRADNIEIVANGASLKTSIRHPVLVYRQGALVYVRADDVQRDDALVQHRFAWSADPAGVMNAWFAGAHLGDGSAHEKKMAYKPTRASWAARARSAGARFVFKIRAAEREVVERYAEFFRGFCRSEAQVAAAVTSNGTPVWDYAVASFAASRAVELIDGQTGSKTVSLRVPAWIKSEPEKYFLPFLAGLLDTDGTVSRERGSASLATQNYTFARELKALLALFGVHGALTVRKPRSHALNGHEVRDSGGVMLKISDSAFLQRVAQYMADSGKRTRILECASQSGQYDHYRIPVALRDALAEQSAQLAHTERQALGFYHGYHLGETVSRIWLDRWETRFPRLAPLIAFARTLRPVDAIRRAVDLPETFYDFEVEGNHNYLAGNDGLLVIHNCGIGYEFSTMRPRGAYVAGAGAYTSGPLSFMDIYDKMCFTVSSAGGRRGAQMGTFDVGHPDVLDFIRAKRENGRLRQFNLSLLVTRDFMEAVKADADWKLAFPLDKKEVESGDIALDDAEQVVWREWPTTQGYIVNAAGLVACKVYKTLHARRVWDMIMASTYDFAEPGFVLIDKVNEMNNNWWCEDIRATNPCGEQPLPPYGACLLGSINLTKFVRDPFTPKARFDWDEFREVVKVFTRMLDNVVEVNGLPLPEQREEIARKRRHGMGFLGLGSAIALLGLRYGSPESIQFTEDV